MSYWISVRAAQRCFRWFASLCERSNFPRVRAISTYVTWVTHCLLLMSDSRLIISPMHELQLPSIAVDELSAEASFWRLLDRPTLHLMAHDWNHVSSICPSWHPSSCTRWDEPLQCWDPIELSWSAGEATLKTKFFCELPSPIGWANLLWCLSCHDYSIIEDS